MLKSPAVERKKTKSTNRDISVKKISFIQELHLLQNLRGETQSGQSAVDKEKKRKTYE